MINDISWLSISVDFQSPTALYDSCIKLLRGHQSIRSMRSQEIIYLIISLILSEAVICHLPSSICHLLTISVLSSSLLNLIRAWLWRSPSCLFLFSWKWWCSISNLSWLHQHNLKVMTITNKEVCSNWLRANGSQTR